MSEALLWLAVFGIGVAAAIVGAMLGGGSLAGSLFGAHDLIDYRLGLVLMAGTAVGGCLGAHLAIRRGDRWVRRLFAVVVVASALRLLLR